MNNPTNLLADNCATFENPAYCRCAGHGPKAVKLVGDRWYIAMGHAGFNTDANNRNGYATEAKARATIKAYQRSE